MANYFKGDDLRSYFHSFGRAFTAKGQNFLDQAPLKSGHTVATSDVRAEAVPYIDANFKLETAFNGIAAGTYILSGVEGSRTVIPELSGILKFYDGVELTEMAATNGETFQLIDGVVIKGLMDPTDQYDSTGKKTADGYTIKVLKGDGTPIPMSEGWVVDPVNGAVTFENGKTPANKNHGKIKIVAFAYVGKYAKAEIENIWKALGKNDENPNLTIADRVAGLEDKVEVLESVETTVGKGLAITSSDAKADKEISLVLTTDTNGLALTADGIRSKVELVKDTTVTNLTKYQLQINGVAIGDAIEIDKERYITSGSYDPIAQELVLGIADQDDPVRIPVTDLITEHVAGAGISINDINVTVGEGEEAKTDVKREISIKKDGNSEDFFYVDATNGIGVSGVQIAIDKAVSSVIEIAPELPTESSISGYTYNTLVYTEKGQAVIVNPFDNLITPLTVETVDSIDEELTEDNDKIATVAAVETYTNNKIDNFKTTVTDPISVIANNALDNMLSGVNGSGVIIASAKEDKLQTISLKVDPKAGNAIETTNGLFVPKFVADEGTISLTEQTDGSILIKGTKEYVLPVATESALGGVKSGNFITVAGDGTVTVNKVANSLTVFGKTYNGSESVTITKDDVAGVEDINTTVASSDALSISKTEGVRPTFTFDLDETKIVGVKASNLTFAQNDTYVWDAIKSLDTAIGTEATTRSEEDAKLATRIDAIDNAVSGTVAGLAGRMTTAEGDIDALEGRMTTAEGDIDALEGRMTTAEGDINTLQSDVEILKTNSKVIKGSEAIKVVGGEAGSNEATISLVLDNKVFGQSTNGLTSKITLKALAEADSGYAATYQLQDGDGALIGDKINIPKDQFLSNAEIITATDADKTNDSSVDVGEKYIRLTFQIKDYAAITVDKYVYIATKDLINEYAAGKGLSLDTTKNIFNIVPDSNADTTKYLVIGNDTIGLSGITDAISGAVSGAVDTLTTEIGKVNAAVVTLNSDVATSGSVRYIVNTEAANAQYVDINDTTTTISAAITSNANAIKTLNSDETVSGSVAYQIKTALAMYDGEIASLVTDIENLNNEINGKTNA